MSITDFFLAPQMVEDLSKRCNVFVLRFDTLVGDPKIFEECKQVIQSPESVVYSERMEWNKYNWRESLLQKLDDVKPKYVLFLDQDEEFGKNFHLDFEDFKESGADLMYFDYEMATNDNREVPLYPHNPHCKAFKWQPGMSYIPYQNSGRVNLPYEFEERPNKKIRNKSPRIYNANSVIRHYCFYTPELQQEHTLWGHIIWQGEKIKANGKKFKELDL